MPVPEEFRMTEAERFTFDLAGFLVRPAIISPGQVADIRDQVLRIHADPHSLPPEHRHVPGGPSQLLIDHPAVVGVVEELIGPNVRIENPNCVVRNQGEMHGGLHGGGPTQLDPIFGYRTQDGKIHAGMVRVIFELSDIHQGDGGTHFLAGVCNCSLLLPAPSDRPMLHLLLLSSSLPLRL
jgi:hypothetical protein